MSNIQFYKNKTSSGCIFALNGEMACTDLDSLHANLKANLDGAERLNQICTNIGDHARILKQSEISMGISKSNPGNSQRSPWEFLKQTLATFLVHKQALGQTK